MARTARNHQRRHHQQEHSDRDLHALHSRVQVRTDVVDHHVHVRPGEAADELSQGQREENAPQSGRHRTARRRQFTHRRLHSVTAHTAGGRPGRHVGAPTALGAGEAQAQAQAQYSSAG